MKLLTANLWNPGADSETPSQEPDLVVLISRMVEFYHLQSTLGLKLRTPPHPHRQTEQVSSRLRERNCEGGIVLSSGQLYGLNMQGLSLGGSVQGEKVLTLGARVLKALRVS